jgi:vancomycin resistance protein VanJ
VQDENNVFRNFIVAGCHIYALGMIVGVAARWLIGDQSALLFLFNTFSFYLLLPTLLLPFVALVFHRREVWASFAVLMLLWAALYGRLWWPKSARQVQSAKMDATLLRVMTYNMWGGNSNPENVVATIQEADPDIVAIQELNPQTAEVVRRDLRAAYPYQLLDPQYGVSGMGFLSRYPFRPITATLAAQGWVGAPQLLILDVNGTSVTVLHLHPRPSFFGAPADMRWTIQIREQQLRAAMDFAAPRSEPMLVLGDMNATDQHEAHRILAQRFEDAWLEAGWGWGGTFPGRRSMGAVIPSWLLRIDYIFYSAHFRALEAYVGPWDGVSDHRPVRATLVLE